MPSAVAAAIVWALAVATGWLLCSVRSLPGGVATLQSPRCSSWPSRGRWQQSCLRLSQGQPSRR
jgi:hypothetical protein